MKITYSNPMSDAVSVPPNITIQPPRKTDPNHHNWAGAVQNVTALLVTGGLAHERILSGEIAAGLILVILGVVALPSTKKAPVGSLGILTLLGTSGILGVMARNIHIITALALSLGVVGCSEGCAGELANSPAVKAAEDFPVHAGETLKALSAAFYSLCGHPDDTDGGAPLKRSQECEQAKTFLNKAIEGYTEVNKYIPENK